MAKTTKKGKELAKLLGNQFNPELLETCSLLCRAATSYLKIQEGHCNGHPANSNPHLDAKTVSKLQADYEKWLEKRESQLTKVIREHVKAIGELSEVYTDPERNKHKVVGAYFQGDPRGATVRLIREGDRQGEHSWEFSHDYLAVPGS